MPDFVSAVSSTLSTIGDLLTFSGGESLPGIMSAISGEVYPLEIGGYKFPFGALMQINGEKNIVVTDIPDAKNSRKEIISFQDYEINITGVLAYKNNTVLINELENLIALFDGASLDITSPYARKFGIRKILIQSFDPVIKQGWQSCLWYTLTGLSDNDIDHRQQVRNNRMDALRRLIGV